MKFKNIIRNTTINIKEGHYIYANSSPCQKRKTQNNFFNRVIKNWNKIPTIKKGLRIKKFRDFLNGIDFTSESLEF